MSHAPSTYAPRLFHRSITSKHFSQCFDLCSLATPQPHSLTVLLQFRDELITLSHNVLVLLVLVIGSVGLDDALAGDAIDCTGDTTGGDEASEVTACHVSLCFIGAWSNCEGVLPIQEVDGDTEIVGHALQADNSVALQELLVGSEAHLSNEPVLVLVEVSVLV